LDIVFIFRGDVQDLGVKLTSGPTETDGSSSAVLRSMSDILIGYSTLPGFSSNRDVFLGTWYIQAICEIFMEHACDTDVEDMLKMVSLSASSLLYILESNSHPIYSFRGLKNQTWIRFTVESWILEKCHM
jgi:hypothetical protein